MRGVEVGHTPQRIAVERLVPRPEELGVASEIPGLEQMLTVVTRRELRRIRRGQPPPLAPRKQPRIDQHQIADRWRSGLRQARADRRGRAERDDVPGIDAELLRDES